MLDPLDFLALAHKYADRYQWSEDDHEDLVQTMMLELLKAQHRYREGELSFDLPAGLEAYVDRLFVQVAWSFYRARGAVDMMGSPKWGKWRAKILSGWGEYADDYFLNEGSGDLTYGGNRVLVDISGEQLFLEETLKREFLQEVKLVLGEMAFSIARELVAPSDKVRHLTLERMKVAQRQKAAGEVSRERTSISKSTIMVALGVPAYEFYAELRKIREVAHAWCQRQEIQIA